MEVFELRKKWKLSIGDVDERFLRMIDALYNTYTKDGEVDFFDELPKEVQQILLESREQAKQGKVRSHEEVMAEFRKKYNQAGQFLMKVFWTELAELSYAEELGFIDRKWTFREVNNFMD